MTRIRNIAIAISALAATALTSPNAMAGGRWKTMATEPTPLANSASAQIDGIVYIAGGRDASGNFYNTLQAFNPVANTWTTLAAMPQALAFTVGDAINGEFYVAGGSNASGPVNTLFMYDPPSNTWTQKADVPETCSGNSAGVINSKLYVTCPQYFTGDFYGYDPATDTWTALASVPVPLQSEPAAGVINGQFYMAGGDNGPGPTEVYNPATNAWTQLKNILTWENELGGAELDGRLYAFGGQPGGCPVTTVQEYDPVLNKWKTLSASMPVASAGSTVQVVYGIAFVIGGVGGGNCQTYSGATQAFFTTPSIP